jgi:dTDP-4-amino-4,6-dideoxygalactose transaminase/acetyltransferase-like isoleucine patch superfamily enzyme
MRNTKYFVHETAVIDERVEVGEGTKIWHYSHILNDSRIGVGCNIGQNVVLGPDVVIGDGCKVQNNVSLYKGVTLEDYVFCGPSMVFTNVFNPRAHLRKMDEARPTMVRQGATLGANCTIVCGVEIGRYALVGAGAVVTRDVPAHALMVGNPARQTGWVCECGEKLDGQLTCTSCAKEFKWLEPGAEKKDVPFIDLAAQQQRILPQVEKRIKTELAHGRYVMGPEIGELEGGLARFAGTKHALTCGSGTDALVMALMALGVGPGDAVFTTPFTFIATAEAICLVGATPVFVDIEADTFNISARELERTILEHKRGAADLRPKAIIPVDMFGLPADYEEIERVAREHGLFVIEDAAQGFGGEYRGKNSGGFGDIGCTSFFPAKPLGCYGDGGALFTDSDELAGILDSIRVHGKGSDKYDNVRLGVNGRLDTLQAAILLPKLEIFPEELLARRKVADRYVELLEGTSLVLPRIPAGRKSAWAQFSVLAADEAQRQKMMARLKEAGVPTAVYYPVALHQQTVFNGLGYAEGDFPVSEDCARRIFSLPMHPYLELADQRRIADLLTTQT